MTVKRPNNSLTEWRQLTKVRPFLEDPEVEAGRAAEAWLQELVESHINYKGAHSFAGKRVLSVTDRKRREIDLIVITPKKLHILEVKNWSGQLYSHGNRWVQVKRNGEQRECDDIVMDNRTKQSILLAYLQQKGIVIAEELVSQKVIFLNRNLRIGTSIGHNPDVITYNKLHTYLNQQRRTTLAERMICAVIDYCLAQDQAEVIVDGLFGSLTQEKFQRIVDAVESLNTWDKLILHGTKVLSGDLIRLHLGHDVYHRRQLSSESYVEVSWTRNKLLGLAKVFLGIGDLGKLVFPDGETIILRTGDTVFFHRAGQPQPEMVPLTHVDSIILG